MTGRRMSSVRRLAATLAVCATLGLSAVACAEGDLPSHRTPADVRKIFVPAETPASWPAGNWQPVPLAEFERLLSAARSAIADPGAASIEQARYEATLLGESWAQGTFSWTIRRAANSSSQADSSSPAVGLDPLNVPLFDLQWEAAKSSVPATWGTDPQGRSLLVCDERCTRLSGAWGLRGRKLARSTDFDFGLPQATVTRLVLHVPTGVLLTANCGDLSGPHASQAPGSTTWHLDLGGHTHCRVRATPAGESLSERPLLIASERTSYVVRPELLRWQVEFEPQVLESELRKFVLALDAGMQLTAVEYGEDGLAAWNRHAIDGRDVIEIEIPESVRGLGQRLLARGFASIPASGAWRLPRARLMHAVSTASDVVLRLQDPFRAADLRPEGYRQVEFTVDSADEETLTFRQFRPDASIVLEPDRSLPRLTCRTVATIRQAPHGWSFDAELDLHAASAGCYAASCRLPSSWSVTDVRPASDEYSEEALRWEMSDLEHESHVLSIDFMNALDPSAPRRVRVQAFCRLADGGDGMALPVLGFGELVEHEMTLFVAAPPGQRGVLDQPHHCRTLSLSEISPEIRNIEAIRSLIQDSASRVLAIRATGPDNSGRVIWHDARMVMPVAAFDGDRAFTSSPKADELDESITVGRPVVVLALRAAVRLTNDSGHDRYVVAVDLSRHDGEAELSWSLDEACELLQVRVDGQPQRTVVDGHRSAVALGAPWRASSEGAPGPGRLPVVEFEYRAAHAAVGNLGTRRLHLPRFDSAPLHYDLHVIAPTNLLPTAANAGFSLTRVATDGSNIGRSLTPVADARVFNPFDRRDWRRLAGFFRQGVAVDAAQDAGDREDVSDVFAGESLRRLLQEAPELSTGSSVWHASGAGFPQAIELELSDATTRRAWGWSACALACLAVVATRTRALRIPRYGIVLAIVTIGFAAIAWGGWLGDVAASALAGSLAGVLLPTRWLLPRLRHNGATTHSGSTPALPSAVAGGVLIAALSGPALEAVGQQPADSERRLSQSTQATLSENTPIDILVPVDGTGQPAAAPVVYVSDDDLAQLRRQSQHTRDPAYLVSSARFAGRVADSKRLAVSIAYEVTALSENVPVQVEFPIAGLVLAGNNPCLVDGRPSPVFRSSNRPGVVVELRPGSRSDSDAVQLSPPRNVANPNTAQVAPRDRHRTHRVEFEAEALVEETEPGVFSATIGALPVDDTVASLAGAPAGAILPVSTASHAVCPLPPPEAADTVCLRLSRSSGVRFRWERGRGPIVAPAAEASASASTTALVDLGSESTRLSWRVDYHVIAGQLDVLHWKLPAGWSVQSLYSSRLAGYTLEAGDADSRRLVVELAEPVTKTISIEASFVRPAQAGSAALLSLPEVAASPDGGVRVALEDYRIGFRHSPQYRLDVTAADPAQTLRPCSVDDFAADWFADGPRPQQAFDLGRAGHLRLALESLPRTLIAKCESRVRCSLDQIDWAFVAEIERPQVPRFQFRLRVDPRLRIRHVSVLEDGAERLWRWSHSAESLVVFLTDRVTRAVTLHVDASLPLAAPGDIALPFFALDSVQFDGTEPAGQMLFLESAADATVALVDATGRNAAELFTESPHAEALPPDGFRLVSDLPPLLLRVTATRPVVTVETYTCFVDGPAGSQTRTMVEYDISGAAAPSLELQLPSRLADQALFVAPRPAEVIERARSDESVVLAFYPLEPVAERFRVFVVTPGDDDASGMREIPAFDLPGAAVVRRSLLVPPGATATTSARQALAKKTDRLPNWLINWPTLAPGFEDGSLVELPPNTRSLAIRPAAEHRRHTGIPLVAVTVDVAADGALAGRLLAWLPEGFGPQVEFAWPSAAQRFEAFIDGYSIATPAIDNGVWTLPLAASRSPRMLSIAWTSPPGSLATIGRRLQQACPWPAQVPVDETFLTLRFPPDLWRWGGAPSRTAATYSTTAAEEISALQNRLTTWRTDRREDEPESPQANATFEQFALTFLAVDLQQAPWRPASVFRLSRYEPHGQPVAAVDPGLLLPRSFLRYTLAIVVMLAAGHRLAGYISRLQEHRAAALFALGLTWWLLLSPSALGLAILLWGGVDAWLMRRQNNVAPAK